MEDDVDKYYRELDPLHPDNFRSRGERAQRMRYPQQTPYRIVIPSNKGGFGFNSKNVDCTEFEGLNKQVLLQTINEATQICERNYSLKKSDEIKDKHKWSYFALKAALILCITSFCVLMIPIYVPDVQTTSHTLSIRLYVL